jgi:hypothetical protein
MWLWLCSWRLSRCYPGRRAVGRICEMTGGSYSATSGNFSRIETGSSLIAETTLRGGKSMKIKRKFEETKLPYEA